ncbi:hypothetical protein [Mesorhizobium humile]|uniref:Uncharacterized protein n=1 Tax=Mesorhizobium humile TaxID=3072313 RepID=A0ABU4YQL5_9HYPH|nr:MULTISPECIES: hypothetical protein [unclassified Mesorhizobium]MDX8459282.1 hypothetical protein [Mesorhizobium sp. VK2D]MDX8488047.1 hypothetical protein [Mesorhizobium sp. VK2B]
MVKRVLDVNGRRSGIIPFRRDDYAGLLVASPCPKKKSPGVPGLFITIAQPLQRRAPFGAQKTLQRFDSAHDPFRKSISIFGVMREPFHTFPGRGPS